MWGYILLCSIVLMFAAGVGARKSMRYAWVKKKEELEELKNELEQMEDITEELKKQKEEIEKLLKNEFRDYDALFKRKKNID